jgi:hypothetical protein
MAGPHAEDRFDEALKNLLSLKKGPRRGESSSEICDETEIRPPTTSSSPKKPITLLDFSDQLSKAEALMESMDRFYVRPADRKKSSLDLDDFTEEIIEEETLTDDEGEARPSSSPYAASTPQAHPSILLSRPFSDERPTRKPTSSSEATTNSVKSPVKKRLIPIGAGMASVLAMGRIED